jgi:hypothetical protein
MGVLDMRGAKRANVIFASTMSANIVRLRLMGSIQMIFSHSLSARDSIGKGVKYQELNMQFR